LPPASAVVSAWAVSVEPPTSVSLTVTSGWVFLYSSTDFFWLIPVNDQNSNVLPSPVLGSELPEHPAVRARTAVSVIDAAVRNFMGCSRELMSVHATVQDMSFGINAWAAREWNPKLSVLVRYLQPGV
jgi:hypothetical protein